MEDKHVQIFGRSAKDILAGKKDFKVIIKKRGEEKYQLYKYYKAKPKRKYKVKQKKKEKLSEEMDELYSLGTAAHLRG